MTNKEYVESLIKCTNIPYEDYSWLKDHCYRTLTRPCSPNTRNEHLAVLKLIEEHEERQWIPVSERMPEDEEYVLGRYANGNMRTMYFYIDTVKYLTEFEDCCETGWYDDDENFLDDQDVIAWMPLPESYKPESEDKE